jgi:hypothetical protein
MFLFVYILITDSSSPVVGAATCVKRLREMGLFNQSISRRWQPYLMSGSVSFRN